MNQMRVFAGALLLAIAFAITACGGPAADNKGDNKAGKSGQEGPNLKGHKGTIKIAGSSTTGPITIAVAEAFQKLNPELKINVAITGTSAGFKRFIAGETDVNNASRKIKNTEVEKLTAAGIDFIELPVAYDGIAVVVHKNNTWCKDITMAELKKIWHPDGEGKVTKWSQVREGWPEKEIKLYGAGADSGTFDYFTDAVNGEEKLIRGDYTPSENDNILVQGVAGDEGAMGFFGLAYLEHNKDKLNGVHVDGGNGPVEPNGENVKSGKYPISRPLFIYIKKSALERPEVNAFAHYYLRGAGKIAPSVGSPALPDECYQRALDVLTKGMTGTYFGKHEGTVADILKAALKP